MKRLRRGPELIAGLLFVAFMAATMISGRDMLHQYALLQQVDRGANWGLTQIEREHLRLKHAVEAYVARPQGISRDDMLRQFDIFWSRVPILLDGEEGEALRQHAQFNAAMAQIAKSLPILEQELLALNPDRPDTILPLRQRLEALDDPVFSLVKLVMVTENYEDTLSQVYQDQVSSFIAFTVSLVAGSVLITILLRQVKRSRRLYELGRKAAGRSVRARGLMRDAIESISEGFLLLDPEERVVLANQRYQEMYPRLAPVIEPGVSMSDLAWAAAMLGQFPKGESTFETVENRLRQLRHPDGPWEQPLSDGRVMLVNERRTSRGGTVSVCTDITQLKQAEELLRRRLTAMEASADGIGIYDAGGRLTYVNRAHADIYGYTDPDDLIARHWSMLYPGEERHRLEMTVMPMVREQQRWWGEAMGLKADGTSVALEVSLTALEDGGLVSVVRDISERKRAEQERASLQEQFFTAQKMEAIGRLAGGIAHDFNNLLAAILGYASFIMEDLPADSPQRGFASQITKAGERAKLLVEQILAFSRREEAGRIMVDIAAVAEETADLLRASLPATMTLTAEIQKPAGAILGNPTQISQILMNLCVNAKDAIGADHGTIKLVVGAVEITGDSEWSGLLATEIGHRGTGPIQLKTGLDGTSRMRAGVLARPGPHVRIAVEDDGCGMSRATMERMFEPFFTTKDVGAGTGLGLAAVHGIVGALGGALVIESRPERGTRFEIFVPAETAAGDTEPAPTDAPAATFEATILVVDDEEQVGTMTAMTLRRLGYEATSCIQPQEALKAVAEESELWDLVVADQMMPGMTGLELARELHAIRPSLPVILCSGMIDKLAPGDLDRAGIAACLAKPVNAAALAAAVYNTITASRRAA